VYVWKEDEGSDLGYVPISKIQAHQTFVTKCCFSPNSEYLATTSADHTVALWQFASSPLSDNAAVGSDTRVEGGWSRIEDQEDEDGEQDGEELEKSGSSIESEIGDDNLILRHSFEGHLKWVWDCAFSADSAYLVSASSDNTARLWSASSGDCICIYTGHTKALTSVALNDLTLT
jgi:G protein beta subunit-like protein